MPDTLFEQLKGEVLTDIQVFGDIALLFATESGKRYVMCHTQICSERVTLEHVVGNLEDLLYSPILVTDESTYDSRDNNDVFSATWTSYRLATIKGYVDIRWYGASNGYYLESVDFFEVDT